MAFEVRQGRDHVVPFRKTVVRPGVILRNWIEMRHVEGDELWQSPVVGDIGMYGRMRLAEALVVKAGNDGYVLHPIEIAQRKFSTAPADPGPQLGINGEPFQGIGNVDAVDRKS